MNFQDMNMTRQNVDNNEDWWHGGIIYQIYPRSFQDSNGDGIGDLKGILQRLPYIASLGVDAIWISPFFKSPMKDFGYDVSDYRDVDPIFGSLEDFDLVLELAHQLGIKVMIDLVLSHTSDKHPWFAESRVCRENKKSDWYVWADPKADGTPPNNWLSIFGGSAWQWDTRRQQYYLHNFLSSQPDLNFHNVDVQNALLDVARFWLERGVDGFRLDTINFYFHDAQLRDNPALPLDKRNSSIAPMVNPYNHQNHLYSKSQPENIAFLEKLRAICDEFDARACLGEVGDAQRGLEIMGQYTKGDKRMHMCYAFEFLESRPLSAEYFIKVFSDLENIAKDAWPCWAFSNHDVKRHASRWNLSQDAVKTYSALMMCMRGSVCLYQGEELGLYEADVAFDDLQDPYGIEFWPEYKGRDGCRTPMVWEAQSEYAGFGNAKPWLPISYEQAKKAVDRQEADPDSMLSHYKKVIEFRHAYSALSQGAQIKMQNENNILIFYRQNQQQTLFCAFNLADEASQCPYPEGSWINIGENAGGTTINQDNQIELAPWQFCILEKQG